jgi:hypothetical protein
MPRHRLLLLILVACAFSFTAGIIAIELAAEMPCRGEGLACNIDQAIGAYAVLFVTSIAMGGFGVALTAATDRTTLLGTDGVVAAAYWPLPSSESRLGHCWVSMLTATPANSLSC